MLKEITKSNMKVQLNRINTKVWSKSDILAFGKMLNSYSRSSQERKDQIFELLFKLDESYDITEDQSAFGINWLTELCFTSKGENRKTKYVEDFRERDFNIVKNFSHFKFVGYHETSTGYYSHYSPIYKCVDKEGNYFEYVARMWQAPEIVGRGKDLLPLELALNEAI
jgi:hypothetical protein